MVAAVPLAKAKKHETLTDDLLRLNAFADLYNEYVEKLQRNIHDLKTAELVVKKWQTIVIN